MYHGVPVVGVPLFGDHYDTMTRVAAKGMGIMLHWKDMTEEDLYARLLSNIHKDQPGHPVSRAVYWIGYILRHNGANHLRSAVYEVSPYQYFLLDVMFAVAAAGALMVFSLRRLVRLLRGKAEDHSRRVDGSMTNGHCHSESIANGRHKRNGSLKTEKKIN
ncbi:hypothetical protein GOODEAATRI_016496 [Goodea atripinnis]|uniref:UDP-glucuronosyltransferase n=1 Tax=Goodea atripinnis TaxID=208336 RepID=A0ABV0N560_9TELE